jgi:hypothetical protein
VYSGPFAGMNYLRRSTGSVILPKLIGTYENELHFVFYELKKKKYEKFIDVRAAEGYYVVGVGKFIFCNNISVIAYESSIKGLRQIEELSSLNSFNNYTLKGTCNVSSLEKDVSNTRSFLLMDAEGVEYYLLDCNVIDFTMCDILVEVHDKPLYHLERILIDRFKFSHSSKIIRPQTKSIPDNCSFPKWVYEKSTYVTNEFRGNQSWLWLESNKYIL